MGIYILLFAIVIGTVLLGYGKTKLKRKQKILGYLLTTIGGFSLAFACYDIAIILHAVLI